MAIAPHCNLKAARRPASLRFNYVTNNAVAYKCNNSAMDLPTIGEHLSVFVTKFVHARAQKLLYFRASGQILTSPLYSATPIFYMVRILWQSMGIYHVTLTFDHMNLNIVWAVTRSNSVLNLSKSNNPRLSHSQLKTQNLGTVRYL